MSAKSKKLIIFGILSCIFAIGFAFLYYFKLIKTLDSFLSLTYICYFTSLALTFLGSYQKENGRKTVGIVFSVFGVICLFGATTMLIYGFATGNISFFN